jgi:hypothetical protein
LDEGYKALDSGARHHAKRALKAGHAVQQSDRIDAKIATGIYNRSGLLGKVLIEDPVKTTAKYGAKGAAAELALISFPVGKGLSVAGRVGSKIAPRGLRLIGKTLKGGTKTVRGTTSVGLKLLGNTMVVAGSGMKVAGKAIRAAPRAGSWLERSTIRAGKGVVGRTRSAGRRVKLVGTKAFNKSERLGQKWLQMSPAQKLATTAFFFPETLLLGAGIRAYRKRHPKTKKSKSNQSGQYIDPGLIPRPTGGRI